MSTNRQLDYSLLARQAQALLSGQSHRVANAANLCALLYQEIPDVNWIGFYFLEDSALILGPFQGQPACVEIPLGQGVCGTAAETGLVQRVGNVHNFDGHIACDTASESELVVPLFKNDELIGVLDLDSSCPDRFTGEDEAGLIKIADIFLHSIQ